MVTDQSKNLHYSVSSEVSLRTGKDAKRTVKGDVEQGCGFVFCGFHSGSPVPQLTAPIMGAVNGQ